MTILIADSSVQVIDRLESLVLEADNSLCIVKAIAFDDALSLFHECRPEVVLLNMNMPVTTSFDLIKQIKATGYKTSIIALSNNFGVKICDFTKQLGADYFLDKYHEFDRIPAIIKKIGEERRMSEIV